MDALAQEFENQAYVALVLARGTDDMSVRRDWLNLAGQWVALAKERKELLGIPSETAPSWVSEVAPFDPQVA